MVKVQILYSFHILSLFLFILVKPVTSDISPSLINLILIKKSQLTAQAWFWGKWALIYKSLSYFTLQNSKSFVCLFFLFASTPQSQVSSVSTVFPICPDICWGTWWRFYFAWSKWVLKSHKMPQLWAKFIYSQSIIPSPQKWPHVHAEPTIASKGKQSLIWFLVKFSFELLILSSHQQVIYRLTKTHTYLHCN